MATWGVYLNENGFEWVSPRSTPMHFIRKITVTVPAYSGGATNTYFDLGIPVNSVVFPFFRCRQATSAQSPWITLDGNGTNWRLVSMTSGYLVGSGTTTVDVYIFSLVIPQPLPKWGAAVFNESGQCIMTNETKPLRIMENLKLARGGTKNYTGNCAMGPTAFGATGWRINVNGDWRPGVSLMSYGCSWNGSTTQVHTRAYYVTVDGEATYYDDFGYSAPIINTDEYD